MGGGEIAMTKFAATCFVLAALLFAAAASSVAHDAEARGPELVFPVTVEGWANTSTARVTAIADITLTTEVAAQVRAEALAAFAKIGPGAKWRITKFSRRADRSGARRWVINAETRLAQSKIDGLRDAAKNASEPGKAYRIGGISATPSRAEREAALTVLRREVYAIAREELSAARILWPDSGAAIKRIDFTAPRVSTTQASARVMRSNRLAGGSAESVAVEQKLTLTATIVLAPAASPSTPR
jgi:hypothetical protein